MGARAALHSDRVMSTCTLPTVNRVKIVARERGLLFPGLVAFAVGRVHASPPTRLGPRQDELNVLWVRAPPHRTFQKPHDRTEFLGTPVCLPPLVLAGPGGREREKVKPKGAWKRYERGLCAALRRPTAPMACALVALHCGASDLSTSLACTDVTPTQKLGPLLTHPYTQYVRARNSIVPCCKISWTLKTKKKGEELKLLYARRRRSMMLAVKLMMYVCTTSIERTGFSVKKGFEVGANKMFRSTIIKAWTFPVATRHETAHKECEAGTNDRYGRMQGKKNHRPSLTRTRSPAVASTVPSH